jgi:phospholipase C
METRREFLKKAAMLSGAAGVFTVLPESIQAALAIDPEQGSTFLDAEHVVILMQENRSFDHCFGMLQGVRGFNDPRALRLADGKPVWLQTNRAGATFGPFRLNMHESNATWMGSLPHGWTDQVDARNEGKYDGWLTAKPSGHKDYSKMPLTLGYYSREDIPFYYALADAFTVCDQHFCSSLTGTTPNRLYLWSGKVRESDDNSEPPCVRNEEVDYGREATWAAFPERLEDHGISWKIYQNEISLPSGFKGEEEDWLANFTDNPIEWLTQYNVRFASGYRNHLDELFKALPGEIEALKKQPESEETKKQIEQKSKRLADVTSEREKWSARHFEELSPRQRNLHEKAFTVNSGDPHYRELETISYDDNGTERKVQVPKGDIYHQFRKDVESGQLPTVSWLVGPCNFSDHPGAAWYGAWYVSEALDILTKNPEVWKKTIFILTYDENDGYFDHVPPFVAPNPKKPETGKVSDGIDAGVEFLELAQDLTRKPAREARESPIGLGYRVPMVIASPWSRGGCVNSQVFDHTSVLQFLETFLSQKTGKRVMEPNISTWRRTVCGDLTSTFQPYRGEKIELPKSLDRNQFVQGIHRAQFKKPPTGFKGLTPAEIEATSKDPVASSFIPNQEKGTRRSCPLPYELYAEGSLGPDKSKFGITFSSKKSAGSPFNAYLGKGQMTARSYAVKAGDSLSDTWDLATFEGGKYHLRVDGPNGFLREFLGDAGDPRLEIEIAYGKSGNLEIRVANRAEKSLKIEVQDNAYGSGVKSKVVAAGGSAVLEISTKGSFGWYDVSLGIDGVSGFGRSFAGRVETGKWSRSDPAMGREKV